MMQGEVERRISLCVILCLGALLAPRVRASNAEAVAPEPIDEFSPSTITSSGYYKLATDLVGTLTISTSCVTLDLNGYCIANGTNHGVVINNNASQIEVRNGTISAPTSGNGIEVASGCDDIVVKNVRVTQCAIGLNAATSNSIAVQDSVFLNNTSEGIKLTGCSRCSLSDCKTSLNTTGILLDECTNSSVQNCLAINNSAAGYSLDTCQRNVVLGCKSLQIGAGVATDSYGFLAEDGSCNSFSCCHAKNTTTTSTGASNVVAGFAFKGSETCSVVSHCNASCSTTPTGGSSTAYGIWLEESFSSLTSLVTGDANTTLYAAAWHPTISGFFALGGIPAEDQLQTYTFDVNASAFQAVQGISHGTNDDIFGLEWTKDGKYLAFAGNAGSGGYQARVYQLDACSKTLGLVQSVTHGATLYATSWSPSGGHLVVGGASSGGDQITLYSFSRDAGTLTSVDTVAHGATVRALKWSPDGQFVLVGSQTTGGNQLFVYQFDPVDEDLTLTDSEAHGATVRGVAWSWSGSYAAIVGDTGTGNYDTRVYSFNSSTGTLTLQDSETHGADTFGVDWSPCGRYIATAGTAVGGNEARLYSFDLVAQTLALQASASTGPSPAYAISWAPGGQHILFAGAESANQTHDVFSALSFPEKNMVTYNTVYCTTGNNIGTSTGISGSNFLNLIRGNTVYNNDRNYCFVSDAQPSCSLCSCFNLSTEQGTEGTICGGSDDDA